MALWNYCEVCGERIETGQPCIGVKESENLSGSSICMNCAKIENLSDGREPVSITDLLARAEAADILGDNYDLDRLRDLVQADRDGRCVVFFAKPGQEVWVVERDEIGKPDCVSGFVFMAEVGGFAIVHPFLGECGDIDEILNNCAEETARNYSCDVSVFPVVDCYESCEAAEAALKAERW